MESQTLARSFVLLAGLALAVPIASADPVQVTGGSVAVYWDCAPTSASLRGNGLNVSGDGLGCGGSAVAGRANLDGEFTFNPFSPPFARSVTVNGTRYDAHLVGALSFETEDFDLPPTTELRDYAVSVPFYMTGRLQGYSAEAIQHPAGERGTPLFDVALVGAGQASSRLRLIPGVGAVAPFTIAYQFSSAEPVPEPATMFLLGTGLAAAAIRKRFPTRR